MVAKENSVSAFAYVYFDNVYFLFEGFADCFRRIFAEWGSCLRFLGEASVGHFEGWMHGGSLHYFGKFNFPIKEFLDILL